MPRARYTLGFFLIVLALAGCGQSGPLYMPGNPSQMTVPSAEPGSSAEEGEAGDNGDGD
jgi:predicted small lipoprotein YifL